MIGRVSFGLPKLAGAFSIGIVLLVGSWLPAGTTAPNEAEILSYRAANGDVYFALSLKAPAGAPVSRQASDIVCVIDTSASQVGEHRQQAMSVLKSVLESLSPQDRVCLLAADVATEQLTDGFVSSVGDGIQAGLARLDERYPAGSSNLKASLLKALSTLNPARPGAVIYIGDGMSTAHLMTADEVGEVVSQFRDQEVPVHSYAVGLRTDLALLGIIGQHTGGMVMFDSGEDSPEAVGRRLADSVHASVWYPTTIELEPSVGTLLPKQALPLRSDRATVYLGIGSIADHATVSMVGETPSGESRQQWDVVRNSEDRGNAFLAALCSRAAENGIAVPLAGTALLNEARQTYQTQLGYLVQLGDQAVADGNVEQAEQVGRAIQRMDAGNAKAVAFLGGAGSVPATPVSRRQPAVTPPAPPAPADSKILGEAQDRRTIRGERLKLEVERAIEQARALGANDPRFASSELKQWLNTVQAQTDIDLDVRDQLSRRLEANILDFNAIAERVELQREQAQVRLSQQEAQARVLETMELEERQLEQLIDKVRALLSEAVHGYDPAYEEAEAVARAAVDVYPGNATGTAALVVSESAGQLNKAFRMRSIRADRYLEALYQVELSHVPFPDEPPIRYPPAEVWQHLTERRKKWAAVDLMRRSPNEERILSALDKPTEVNFVDIALPDAMAYLGELHEIPMYYDRKALEDDGIVLEDVIINVGNLSGIKLRSALKLMLEPHDLAYIIEDEVMKITTAVKEEETLSTRVYPVGDLVIPIITPQGGGGGGGLGGGGGGLGGGGGGGFGGGGGGGGFGGGGGGGGFYSVPAETFSAPEANVAPTLDRKTSGTSFSAGQSFAQVRDNVPRQSSEFNNESIRDLKKN